MTVLPGGRSPGLCPHLAKGDSFGQSNIAVLVDGARYTCKP